MCMYVNMCIHINGHLDIEGKGEEGVEQVAQRAVVQVLHVDERIRTITLQKCAAVPRRARI